MKNNGNKGLYIFTGLLIILVLVLGGYIVYDKFFDNNNNLVNDVTGNDDIVDGETSGSNIDFSELLKDDDDYVVVAEESFSASVVDKNDNAREILLTIDGNVYIKDSSNRKIISKLNGLSGVVSLISFSEAGGFKYFYMLTENGEVYKYYSQDTYKNNYVAEKLDNLSNVKRIEHYSIFSSQPRGSSWGVVAITDSEYFTIAHASV